MSTDQDDSDSSFTMEPPPDREEIERQIKDLQELLGEIDEEEDVKPDDKWTAIGIFPLMIAGLAAIFAIFWVGYPLIDDNYLASPVPEALENQIFHWRHNVGWDFRVQIGDNNGEGPPLLHWEGLQPPFAGWKKTVEPSEAYEKGHSTMRRIMNDLPDTRTAPGWRTATVLPPEIELRQSR